MSHACTTYWSDLARTHPRYEVSREDYVRQDLLAAQVPRYTDFADWMPPPDEYDYAERVQHGGWTHEGYDDDHLHRKGARHHRSSCARDGKMAMVEQEQIKSRYGGSSRYCGTNRERHEPHEASRAGEDDPYSDSDLWELQTLCSALQLSSVGTMRQLVVRVDAHQQGYDRTPHEPRGDGHAW